jgi:catechol 2,3-dioxygenase-like lactoylglutathione lyase family enzyme
VTSVRVEALDHVNIITSDLDGTAGYYSEVFGLQRRNAPPPLTPDNAQWMYDAVGRAIVHINSVDCPRAYEREVAPGPTGALHHVALRCAGYDDVLARLAQRGVGYQLNEVLAARLRQIFTLDPNGILLELNFFEQ